MTAARSASVEGGGGEEGRVDIAGRHVLVAGAGVTGKSIVPALVELGARVTVTDGNAERLAELEGLGAELAPGLTEPPSDVVLVVTSPGWRPTSTLLVAAVAAGVEVIGDVELAWRVGQLREHPPSWLVITGTNGKTTTAGMLESILRRVVDADRGRARFRRRPPGRLPTRHPAARRTRRRRGSAGRPCFRG